jgi:hypothetical protein
MLPLYVGANKLEQIAMLEFLCGPLLGNMVVTVKGDW